MKGKGIINHQRVGGEVNIFLPVERNTCNHCWKICSSESSKIDHMKDKDGPHKALKLDAFCGDCGCVYTNGGDLSVHANQFHRDPLDDDDNEDHDDGNHGMDGEPDYLDDDADEPAVMDADGMMID